MPNKTLIFKKVPTGVAPVLGKHLVVEDRAFDHEAAPPPEDKSHVPFEIDGPIDNSTISKVPKSDTPSYKLDDIVTAYVPIAEYNLLTKNQLSLVECKIGEPKRGQTLFITSAAGAVGQLVGQLAKLEGLKLQEREILEALQRLAPGGIDTYYDNVVGAQFEATLLHMKTLGRLVISGAVSQYSLTLDQRYGIRTIPKVDARCLRIQGFLVWYIAHKYRKAHHENVQKWLSDGSLSAKLHEDLGIDTAAESLAGMLRGNNFGKAILKIHLASCLPGMHIYGI